MIFDLLNTLIGSLTIGLLFGLAFIHIERAGNLGESAGRVLSKLPLVALAWLLSAIGNLLATLAELFDSSIADVLDGSTLRSYLTQTSLGRVQLIQVISALLVLLVSNRIRKTGGAVVGLLISIAGVVAPLFQSHTSQAGSHGLAIGTIIVHVIALSFWFGAVIALIQMTKSEQELALPRVSSVATWSLAAVVVTGAVSALLRLGLTTTWFSTYGLMIILKILILISILIVARQIRRGLKLVQLVKFEGSLFILNLLLGAALSRFTPLNESQIKYDRVRDLVGVSMPAEPNLLRIFFEYEADGLVLASLILLTALYIKGVVFLYRRGVKWPIGRTISFAIGISLIDYATSGGIGFYSIFSFQYHMIAHMIISMIAPIAIVLSAPITLALRTLPIGRTPDERGIRHWVLALIHSRVSAFFTHPIIALAIFDGSLFALYFTPLFGELMGSHFGHLFMTFHFIAAGLLFFYVIIGIDPNPRKVPYLLRIVILLGAMSIHAFFSIALMSSSNLIDGGYYESLQRTWSVDLLSDQRLGAAIGWAMGEIPIVLALAATFIQWMRSDSREAKRADKDDARPAQYNEYLRRLADGERGS